MAMVCVSPCALVATAPLSSSITAAPSSSSPSASLVSLAPLTTSLSTVSAGPLQARCSFQQFDGHRGEGSVGALHSFRGGISTKAHTGGAFSVRAASAVADEPAVAAPSKQKIRIKLKSYWTHLIQQACLQILEAAKNTNAQTMGPVPLPTKKRVYCVLRSPHVDKDSREHFEIRTHHRLIDLINPNAQTVDALMQLDLPAGVDVEVKLS